MKRFIRYGLISLFVLLLPLGSMMVHTTVQAQSYGQLINYVGIVRGATQRLVKLELLQQPNDGLITYLDGILAELTGGTGPYELITPRDDDYQRELTQLDEMWGALKTEIMAYRADGANEAALLALSEAYFEQANATVFAADAYAVRETHRLLCICLAMLGVMLLTWLLIFGSNYKKLLHLESANKALDDRTKRDPLTGVYQFGAFKTAAQRLLDAADQEKYALVYVDFSDFNYVNEVFGSFSGDQILKRYGEILLASLRPGELCGRVVADNFVLLVLYDEKADIVARQRQIDQEIAQYMTNVLKCRSLSTNCGICCLEDTLEELKIEGFLDRANFARKTVKNGTNPNYVFYDESIRNRLREEKDVENHMKDALKRQEFQVYYQPKVDLSTDRIACAEALVRWQLPDGTLIPPDKFIPVFEQKFMIGELDQYVFETVCRHLRQRLDQGQRVETVSVNVSRLQFYDQDFVQRYVAIRDRYQVPPELLEIEFTESIVMDSAQLMLKIVRDLKQAGFSCSIDDFGKGYSSLSLLKDLPIDVVKIDQFFFADGHDQARDLAVVQGIVELVQKFEIRTVAEGIELPQQVAYLKEIGCDYVQGYVYYRPMPQAAYDTLLDEGK